MHAFCNWEARLSYHHLSFKCNHTLAQMVKNLPAVQETWVWSLGWEDPLEKEMATHSSILAWKIPRTEEPGGLQSMGSQRVRRDWVTNTKKRSLFTTGSISCNFFYIVQFSSVTQSCPTLCNPMNHSTPGLPVHHQLPEFTQTHVHRVSDANQPSHPLSIPFSSYP